MANDQERRFAAATGFGLTMAKPILQNQVFLLRPWADNIERFAQLCENGSETLGSDVERELRRERAA